MFFNRDKVPLSGGYIHPGLWRGIEGIHMAIFWFVPVLFWRIERVAFAFQIKVFWGIETCSLFSTGNCFVPAGSLVS